MTAKHRKDPEIVYIAGPMRGLPDLGRAKFNEAEERLRREGWIVLNPARLPVGMPEACYMPICLAMLEQADIICTLDGWQHSQGAQLEMDYAAMQGKDVIRFADLLPKEA